MSADTGLRRVQLTLPGELYGRKIALNGALRTSVSLSGRWLVTHTERSLIVVGSLRDEAVTRLREATSSVGVAVTFVEACAAFSGVLQAADPLAIVLQMEAAAAQSVCSQVRAQARLAHVPILGVPHERNDVSFTELFTWGGDDVVSVASAHPLARRLRPLVTRAAAQGDTTPTRRGQAIVAGSDATWRSVMGRALYNGGLSVRFVTTADDLVKESRVEDVQLVVATDDLWPGETAVAAACARSRGESVAWVVVAPPKRMPAMRQAVASMKRVAVADGYAPPENVMFLANELLCTHGVDKRASARLLYGTAVTFRAAGREDEDVGFSYNISAGGVYVRTLASLEPGQEVWLEMWPPRSERRVRLAGTIAWRRTFGPNERATVPAGFGVQITDGLAGDLERWRAGYEAFAAQLLGAGSAADSA